MSVEKIKDEVALNAVAEDLDKASEYLERAFNSLAKLGYIDNGDTDKHSINAAYEMVDESAIVSIRQNILEKLGQI